MSSHVLIPMCQAPTFFLQHYGVPMPGGFRRLNDKIQAGEIPAILQGTRWYLEDSTLALIADLYGIRTSMTAEAISQPATAV